MAFGGAALGALGLVYGLVVMSAAAPIDETALRARIQASMPTWESYQEDIKGQLGARPAAEWRGELTGARIAADGAVDVLFRIEGPWAERDLGVPILVRDPELRVTRAAETIREDGLRVYRVPLAGAASLPWIEVQYPHHTRRIGLDAPR